MTLPSTLTCLRPAVNDTTRIVNISILHFKITFNLRPYLLAEPVVLRQGPMYFGPSRKDTLPKGYLSNKDRIIQQQVLWMPLILPLTKGHLSNEDKII